MSDSPDSGTVQELTVEEAGEKIAGLLEPVGSTKTPDDQTDEANQEAQEGEAEPSDVSDEDETQPEAEEVEATEAPELHEITVQTETGPVTRKVNVDELRDGYMRDSDYRQKTNRLVDDRRQHEAEITAGRQATQVRLQQLDTQITALDAQLNGEEETLNTLLDEDPVEYARQKAHLDQRRKVLDKAKTDQGEQLQRLIGEQQTAFVTWANGQRAEIGKHIPEYADPVKGPQFRNSMTTYLHSVGFNDQELGGLIDHRMVMIANKARLWDESRKALPGVKKKLKAAPKMAKPGTSTGKGEGVAARQKARVDRLRKSGSIDDAAKVFEVYVE